jgi:hypothetical protein
MPHSGRGLQSNPVIYCAGKWQAANPLGHGEAGVANVIPDGRRS